MFASWSQVGSGLAGDMRSVAEGPKGRATGAFPRVTESARPDMRYRRYAPSAHIGEIQPRRASKRTKTEQETTTFENGISLSSAAMWIMPPSLRAN